MLDKKEFEYAFMEELQRQLQGREYRIVEEQVLKVNERKKGFVICLDGNPGGSVVYPADFYKTYQEGMEVKTIAENALYSVSVPGVDENIRRNLGEHIHEYEYFKDKLRPILINRQQNSVLLKTVPYEKVADLAVIPCIFWENEHNVMSMKVTHNLAALWKKTPEEIMEQVKRNQENYARPEIRSMESIFKEAEIAEEDIRGRDMYILHDAANHYGASCIYGTNVLDEIFKECGEFQMLPSSVHEWLIVRENNISEIEQIVREVNRSVLEEGQFLSDHVYSYDGNIHVYENGKELTEKQLLQEEERVIPQTPKK